MNTIEYGEKVQGAAEFLLRYGLVMILGWFGAMKFTGFEAEGIQPLIASSPLIGWTYRLLSPQALSNLLGFIEITIAVMIALRPLSATVAAIGSGLAVITFSTTFTFLFSLPGWEQSLGGFPFLGLIGGFLAKDLILLAASIWLLGEALSQTRRMPQRVLKYTL